jgi:hypothetical protein
MLATNRRRPGCSSRCSALTASPGCARARWISYYTGWRQFGEGFGRLTAGYGARPNPSESGGKIGPEFLFGISMDEAHDEPVLIIKTAWGGKSLNTDFRPPSAGPYELPPKIKELWAKHPEGAHGIPGRKDRDKWRAEKAAATGRYYRYMMRAREERARRPEAGRAPIRREEPRLRAGGLRVVPGLERHGAIAVSIRTRHLPGGYASYSEN